MIRVMNARYIFLLFPNLKPQIMISDVLSI